MSNLISEYISTVNSRFLRGNATEHSYRGDLQVLIEGLLPEIAATNEPKRQACGAPDYILTKKDIDVGFIEAKNIADKDLEGKKKAGNKEQFDRYKASLNNLIFTDYLDFHFYRDGELVTKIALAELSDGAVQALPENFASFENLLSDFCSRITQTVTNPQKLAEMMAGKARLLSDIISKSLSYDIENEEKSTLQDQFKSFRDILIHDITPAGFADVYAQTIAYGMFAARLHEPTLKTFSRQEAAELIPKTNPFLRKLFQYIAGYDLDDRIKWVVDDLVQIFLACNVREILKGFGKATETEEPIIHFYETFLAAYDPKLRKARGVWYTPAPVVNFIVRAVDDILKTEFGLKDGLADTSKTKVKMEVQGKKTEQEIHKVQILDPATGTGTFLAEIIKQIYKKRFKAMQGAWSGYVENQLLPRLNGFELLMASYAMAHLQLDLLLGETGYKPTSQKAANQRLKVYLTNSLEESHPDTGTLFASWLSAEANEANQIKRDTPVMCIIGNPPYSGESQNKGKWISDLMADYKKEPGGKQKLQEKNSKWINDDYVKFMRYGQHFIEKNGSGILAFINPHGFLDNPTFRGMRWDLLKTYDKIYTIDLHGNSNKKETAFDGSADQNVFDIKQGVSVNILVKTGKKKEGELAKVFHHDLYGKREDKYDFLLKNSLKTIPYIELPNKAPMYFMVQKDFDAEKKYEKGLKVNSLFPVNAVGICSKRDSIAYQDSINELEKVLTDFLTLDEEIIRSKYTIRSESRDQKIVYAKKNISDFGIKKEYIKKISVKPFDNKYTYHTNRVRGFLAYPVYSLMKHFSSPNLGLVIPRMYKEDNCIFVTNHIISHKLCSVYDGNSLFPLYLYPDQSGQEGKRKRESGLKTKKLTPIEYRTIEIQLEQAQKQLNEVEIFFLETVTPFFEAIEKPDEDKVKLFEENQATYEELRMNVENLKTTLQTTENKKTTVLENTERQPNLDKKIVAEITKKLGIPFVSEKETGKKTFAPIDILDYIYAVLHSPAYREKYKEFLKIDFPRVPYPDKKTFWELVKLGREIRQLHLMEHPGSEEYITGYPVDGSNEITTKVAKKDWELTDEQTGRIWINDEQYFENIPLSAWEFYIGGYQPAQKWLKDRRGRTLEFDDILHYQKIIVALSETERLMQEIDKVLEV